MQWVCESPQPTVHLTKSKKKKKNKDRYRGQGSRQFLLCRIIKYQVASSDWHVFASLPLSENESMYVVNVHCDLLITTYNVLKVCHCQNPPDHPLHISAH